MATTTTIFSNMLIAFQPNNNVLSPKLQPPPSSLSQTLIITTRRKRRPTTTCKATYNDSSSSTVTQLLQQPSSTTANGPHVLHQQQQPQPQPQPQPADVWRKLHGQDNWEGLLDPMDPLMRAELIRYGEMAEACADSFDYDPWSRYCGTCRYPPHKLFSSVYLSHLGYDPTRYLYATANVHLPSWVKSYFSKWADQWWSDKANWIGYVAVSDDETSRRIGRRDIAVVWRGTVTHTEWVADCEISLKHISPEIPCDDGMVNVESGFLQLYTDKELDRRFCKYSARQQVLSEVKRLVEEYQEEELSITVTGHSLGAALAVLNAFDIAETGLNVNKDGSRVPVSAITFAGPRVGNLRFKERLEYHHGVKVLRVTNVHDKVPNVPGFFVNENSPEWMQRFYRCYTHVGVHLELDHDMSTFLKHPHPTDLFCPHNLEAHLHLIDGYRGSKHGFEPTKKRDPALVNKHCDFLKDKLLVPPVWWQEKNKGLERTPDGHWVSDERPHILHHSDDLKYIF